VARLRPGRKPRLSAGERRRRRARRFAKDRDKLAAVLLKLQRCKLRQEADACLEFAAARNRGDDAAALRAEIRMRLLRRQLESGRFADLALRVRGCHRTFRGYRCRNNGHVWAEPVHSCHVRLCPFEMRERATRAQSRFGNVIAGLRSGKYAVFAERNCPVGDLANGLKSLFDAWARLRKHPIWAYVKGSLVVLEVTYNRQTRAWHPHLNVVFDGPFLPFEKLNQAWIEATRGNGRTSFIRRADRGTAWELIKYLTKLSDFVDVPEAVEDFVLSTKRRRFIRTYGSLYNSGLENEEDGRERCCPDCGAADIQVWVPSLYEHQVALDARGVIRVAESVLEGIAKDRSGASLASSRAGP